MRSVRVAIATVVALGLMASTASAQAADGAAVFEKACANCHQNPAADSRAPNRTALAQLAPETILTALTTGNMFRQGSALSDAERRAVSAFLTGRAVGTAAPLPTQGRCTVAAPALRARDVQSGWNGWGAGVGNTRYVPAAAGGVTAPMMPRMKLKWAFGFPGVSSARSQPAVLGGRVFVGSESGDIFALDAKTGCTHWSYHAQAGIRTALSVAPYKPANGPAGFAVFFADGTGSAYAVDAATGREIWTRKLDSHPYAKATGSVTVHDGRVYVPLAGVGEEGQGGGGTYECCTFRGSVTALNANTGAVIWKAYTIADEPKPRGKNPKGITAWGPAGGGIWAAPTVDAKRKAIYVATGNGYTEPAVLTTDAVLAFDLNSGKLLWSQQPLANDVWVGGCRPTNPPDNPNCPEKLGPDFDFSASPMLVKQTNGKELVVIQQKSGMVYAFDPDKKGEKVWEYRSSPGGGMGGQWGGAADDRQAYFSVNGTAGKTPGGIRAVRIDTGAEVWSKEASERLCGTERGCSAAQGAAVSALPGIVLSGSMDGGLRAYASDDGTLVWSFDTNKEFETVNGVKAKGGAMDGPGAAVANGMIFINSGYVSLIGRPGNVLLAFGVD
ncbi:MAG TPA: PQQ-binding-like beta-propeller repeat protein [Vicinamibacterales bacterium]|nr:PQQ-binding-like beta-propeller repeat protein [Vicinamibacterales bacterium]